MRIASFGDLHLSHRPTLDKFQLGEEMLLRFDDHLCRSHDRIILMGDLYQTDYGVWPGSRREVLEEAVHRYAHITRRWKSFPYRILFGNHDRVAQKFLGAVKQIRLNQDGWRIWFIHGHQFDPFIGEKARLPYFVTWMIGGLRRKRLKGLADFLEGPFYNLGQRLGKRLEKAAQKALMQGRIHIIVMGHSHQITSRPYGGGVYLNSGAPQAGMLPYVSIDTEKRLVEIRAFNPPNGFSLISAWGKDVKVPKLAGRHG